MAAERLGLGPQVYQLKIGQSFLNDANGDNAKLKGGQKKKKSKNKKAEDFHTIRYDFKPASIDEAKMGSLEVAADGKTVSVSVPTNSGGDETVNYG